MKKLTMLMTLAATLVAAPLFVSAQCCPAARKDGGQSCGAAKAKCARVECKEACKCPAKAACAKEGCKEACKCPKAAEAKKS